MQFPDDQLSIQFSRLRFVFVRFFFTVFGGDQVGFNAADREDILNFLGSELI
jgi:hypothetical protein